jgi:hypothetical protein
MGKEHGSLRATLAGERMHTHAPRIRRAQNLRVLAEGIRRRPLKQRCAGAHRQRNQRIEVSRSPERTRRHNKSEQDDGQQNDSSQHRSLRLQRAQQREREQAERQAEGCEPWPRPG